MPLQKRIIPLVAMVIVAGVTIKPANAHWCYNGSKLNKIERAICSDSGLIAKDQQLNALYKKLGGRGNSRLKASQRQWMRGRNGCGSMACLHAYYDNRLNDLRIMAYGNSTPVAPAPPPRATYTPPPPVVQVPDTSTSATTIPSSPAPRSSGGTSSEPLEKLPDIKPF